MFFGKNIWVNSKKEISHFWSQKEREIGEKIKGHCIGQHIKGYDLIQKKMWGFIYYTDQALYFEILPGHDKLSSILFPQKDQSLNRNKIFAFYWEKSIEMKLPNENRPLLKRLWFRENHILINYCREKQKIWIIFSIHSRQETEKLLLHYQRMKKRICHPSLIYSEAGVYKSDG